MNKHTTKRALVASILALAMCFSMLVGTTLAWFTDSATSTGNVIETGTLKVDLEVLAEDNSAWSSVKAQKTPIFNYTNWEPGFVQLKLLRVENEGSLALKWKATLSSENGVSELADVIDVYVKAFGVRANDNLSDVVYPTDRADVLDGYTKVGTLAQFIADIEATTYGTLLAGEKAYLGIAFKMQDTADDYYQAMTLGEFDIRIVAGQLAYEEDSWNDGYDADATYPIISNRVPVDADTPAADTLFKTDNMNVTVPADLIGELASDDVGALQLMHTAPKIEADAIIFDSVEFYDDNGNVIDLEALGNAQPLTVNLYVGDRFAEGDRVKVFHNGEEVAAIEVDAQGYVTYTALHFCEVTVAVNTDPITVVVNDVDELLAAFETVAPGNIIDATGVVVTISTADHFYIPGGYTIKGLTINASYRGGNYVRFGGTSTDVVTFENCSFGNSDRNLILGGTAGGAARVVYNNCTLAGSVLSNFHDNTDGVAEFNNCTFTAAANKPLNYQFTEAMGGTHIYNGCTFDFTGVKQASMGVITSGCLNVYSEPEYFTVVELRGCTFINCGTRTYGANSTLIRK